LGISEDGIITSGALKLDSKKGCDFLEYYDKLAIDRAETFGLIMIAMTYFVITILKKLSCDKERFYPL
jgi:hypothetical protein